MQIQSNPPTAILANGVQTNTAEVAKPTLSIYEQTQKMQNLAVLSANNSNSKSVADNPMELLYKTAIEEINKKLEPTLGKNAAQSAYDSNLDVSPEATAQRIVQGSTAFYEAFKEQNSELSEEDALTEFISVISSGIDKGFDEAKGILDSLSVLEGDIETNIDATYGLVQQGITDFKELFLAKLAEKSPANDESEP